jgi:hypothetical protein
MGKESEELSNACVCCLVGYMKLVMALYNVTVTV